MQTHIKEKYLSCWRPLCDAPSCGGAIFEGSDWTHHCRGEVFQIFKPYPGAIRSGDLVGLHYTAQPGNWLGCRGNECKKETCPGHPSTHHGFTTVDNWYRCYKNVYQIFAYNKRKRAKLYSGDDVMLYFLYSKTWVNGDGRIKGNDRCPEYLPSSRDKFDDCPHEVFKIILKDDSLYI